MNICSNTLEQIHKSYIKHLINTKIHICPLQDEYEEARSNKGTMSFSVLSNEFSLMTNIMRRNETKMKPDCQSFGRVERERETCTISHLGSRTNQINTKEEEGRKRSTKEVVTFWSEEDIKMLHTTDLFLLRLLMRRWDTFLQSSTLARTLNLSIDPPLQKLSLCMISVCRWDAFSKGIRTQFPNLMSYLHESSPKYRKNIETAIAETIWFQEDGATDHSISCPCTSLDDYYRYTWCVVS